MENEASSVASPIVETLFSVGAHYGYKKSRRHPSVSPYIFGVKNRVEIFDLVQTSALFERAKEYVRSLGAAGKTMLFVGTKFEAKEAVRAGALEAGQPFVVERWIGGALTNLSEIRKRVNRLETLRSGRESGEFDKYTKKERLLLDREIAQLEKNFGGIVAMAALPAVLFVVDPREESTALREAKRMKIPVVALASSDCDITNIAYPIVGNDAARGSITFFVNEIAKAYQESKTNVGSVVV
ncbi:MAG: 30S ribosomal protein S2 [bacterium]|nr:30S ribosomal protein S2 [bacterium]MDZ4284456.1 30S ribosomal protein S2 [Patescibacteria group bacterium]